MYILIHGLGGTSGNFKFNFSSGDDDTGGL